MKTDARSSSRSKCIEDTLSVEGAQHSSGRNSRPTRALRSKRKATPHLDLRSRPAQWIRHVDLNATAVGQNDARVFCAKALIQDASVGLDLPIRRLGSVVNVAVDLIDHLTKL